MKARLSFLVFLAGAYVILLVVIFVHLWMDFRDLDASRLEMTLLYLLPVLLVLAVLIASLYRLGITPLHRLIRLADSVSRGDETWRSPDFVISEFQSLGQAINRMLDRIMAQKAELEQLNRGLEVLVNQRTLDLEKRNRELEELNAQSRRNEQALAESEEHLKLALEGANLGLWDWNHLDTEPVYTRHWHKFLVSIPLDVEPGMDGWMQLIHSDDVEEVRQRLMDHLEGRTANFSAEYRVRTAAGGWVWVLDQGRVNECNADGKPVCIAGIIQDITNRKTMEQELRSSVVRFHAIFDRAGIGISLVDGNGRILEANRALQVMLDYTAQELRGQEWSRFVHPPDAESIRNLWKAIADGAMPSYHVEQRYLCKDGRLLWCNLVVTGVAADPGQKPYSVVMLEDISRRIEIEQTLGQLYDTERKQRQLAQTLREVGENLSSALEFETLVDSLLKQIPRVVPCDVVDLIQVDGNLVSVTHRYSVSQSANEKIVETPAQVLHLDSTANLRWMVEHQRPLVVSMVAEDVSWVQIENTEYIQSWVGAPIILQEQVVAFLSLSSRQPGFYNQQHAEVLVAFCGQVALAIQNSRLFEATQRRAQEAETLRQAVTAVVSAFDLDAVLDEILTQLERVVPFRSAAVFLLEGEYAHLAAGRNFPDPTALLDKFFPANEGLFLELRTTLETIILADARNDPRFHGWGGVDYVGGWMGLPLVVRGELIGCVTVDSDKVNVYTKVDADLARVFADEVAIAIVNARLFSQVRHMASTDPLTDVYNRRYFYDSARAEFERSRRYQHPLSVILIDLDHFKRVNDTFGHLTGDYVLVEATKRMRQVVREVDLLARYGGEEFIVLLPETSQEGAALVAERLRQQIMDTLFFRGGNNVKVSISLGLASLDKDCPDLDALLERADQALYAAKEAGRGRMAAWQQDYKPVGDAPLRSGENEVD
jgi:diguanylate cyclase (GGDEF)-like protein/PAS domain S-box-containing protein